MSIIAELDRSGFVLWTDLTKQRDNFSQKESVIAKKGISSAAKRRLMVTPYVSCKSQIIGDARIY
jgi:hypothetical protein